MPRAGEHNGNAHAESALILGTDTWAALAAATQSGQPYETRLNPPPADPRVAHPATIT